MSSPLCVLSRKREGKWRTDCARGWNRELIPSLLSRKGPDRYTANTAKIFRPFVPWVKLCYLKVNVFALVFRQGHSSRPSVSRADRSELRDPPTEIYTSHFSFFWGGRRMCKGIREMRSVQNEWIGEGAIGRCTMGKTGPSSLSPLWCREGLLFCNFFAQHGSCQSKRRVRIYCKEQQSNRSRQLV